MTPAGTTARRALVTSAWNSDQERRWEEHGAQDGRRKPTPMLKTHTEFPDPAHPAHAVAVVHKLQVCDWFRALAEGAGANSPQVLAEQLLLVLNGTLSTAAVLGRKARPGRDSPWCDS